MINYGGFILSFIAGWLLHKYRDKISSILSTWKFFLVNYRTITKSKTFNEFYEDYITQKDFVKEVDNNDE